MGRDEDQTHSLPEPFSKNLLTPRLPLPKAEMPSLADLPHGHIPGSLPLLLLALHRAVNRGFHGLQPIHLWYLWKPPKASRKGLTQCEMCL